MSGFFSVGITGLNAAQAGLVTTGHNISNASTAGYNRQYIVQTTAVPLFTGSGFLGQGTSVQTVQRVYSDFLQKEVRLADTNVAQLQTYSDQISQIDSLLADPSAGLSPALQSYFSAADEAAANPSSIPARQAMLSAGQSLAARFNSLDQQLSQIRDGANTQITNEISSINAQVQQVANINERIAIAQAATASQPANDLLDQRDQLVTALNKELQVTVQTESDGSYSLFFGTGQPLLVGGQVYQLKAQPSPEDMTQLNVALQTPAGATIDIPPALVTGGTLGGLVNFRAQTLDTAQNDLGKVAMAMADSINAQHRLGQDIDGNAGGDFFKMLSPGILPAPTNSGTANFAANVTISDYRVSYDGSNYSVTRLSDNTVFPPSTSMPLVVDGIKLSLAAGTPRAGDVFMVTPGALPSDRVTKLQSQPPNHSDSVLATTGSNLQTLGNSDYRMVVTGPGTLSLTRLSDNTTWIGQGTTQAQAVANLMDQIAPQGFSLSLTGGTATVGDSFLIRPTRNAARDFSMAISDPRTIALAQGFRTGAAPTNAGTGSISDGNVIENNVPLGAPVKLTYDAASNSLTGFPVGAKVVVGATVYAISSSIQKVPFSSSQTYSFNGTGFVVNGTPANGDSFIVNPPPAGVTAGNNGLTALFGGTVAAASPATGSVVPATATAPFTVVAGANDKFDIAVDGGATKTITLTAGSYTPAALKAEIQTQLDATVGAGAVTASLDAANHMVLTSNGGVPSVALSQTAPNLGVNGFSALFGTSTVLGNTATGSVALASPTVISAGVNDQFQVSIDGKTAVSVTLTAGSYATPAALAAQMQLDINNNATIAAEGVSVAVTANGGNQLVMTSSNVIGSVALNGGMSTGPVSSKSSLPAAPITLTYRQATTTGLPVRLTGFPDGSVVTVTKPDGTTREYAMNSADGYSDAANYSDYVDFTSGSTISFNGMSFTMSGNPADGDQFTVGPNTSATGDNRNVLAISALQLKNMMDNGTATYQAAYSSMVSLVGNKAREITTTQTAQENLVTQATNAMQSASGVNLDEEAANLLRYQQAYQASAKVLSLSSTLFDTLLSIGH